MLWLGVRLANDAPLAVHQVGNFLGPHRIEQLAQIDSSRRYQEEGLAAS